MKRFTLALLAPLSLFAVLDIKPIEIGEDAGLSSNVALSFETKRGNTDKDIYRGDIKVQYDNNVSNTIYAQVSGAYAKANKVENINKITLHIRDLQKLFYNFLVAEFFIQSQRDKFKSIQERDLVGSNLRFSKQSSSGNFYIGLGLYKERLLYLDKSIDTDEYNTRLNSYFAYSIDFSEDASLSYLGYYQPKLQKMSDYYISQELELDVALYKELSLNFKLEYNIDSNPAQARQKEDFSQITAFSYEF